MVEETAPASASAAAPADEPTDEPAAAPAEPAGPRVLIDGRPAHWVSAVDTGTRHISLDADNDAWPAMERALGAESVQVITEHGAVAAEYPFASVSAGPVGKGIRLTFITTTPL